MPKAKAFWKDYLYVGEPTSVKRYKYDGKALTAGLRLPFVTILRISLFVCVNSEARIARVCRKTTPFVGYASHNKGAPKWQPDC